MVEPVRKSPPEYQQVERHVGLKIRQLRTQLGLTQQQLAEMIGVTYQQAHKYERGINRVSAGRLYEIARVLGAEVSYFFEGLEDGGETRLSGRQRLCLEVSRNFSHIEDERHHHNVINFGNTGAAGAPGVISMNWDRWTDRDDVAVVGVGSGLSWSGHVLRFGETP